MKHVKRRVVSIKKDVQYIYITDIELNVPDSENHIEMVKLVCSRGKKQKTIFSKKGQPINKENPNCIFADDYLQESKFYIENKKEEP